MDILVLDTNFNVVSILENYESFIWTDRYAKAGDFEFYASASSEYFDLFKQDMYLKLDMTEHLMVIESIDTISDPEDGNKIKVTGRSLESILDRRIIWNQTSLTGDLQTGIKTLITDAIISPSIEERKISNFIFKENDDSRIEKLTINSQYTGDNLYDVIVDICEDNKLGFRITLDSKKNFIFELYYGTDRSDKQTDTNAVIFSYDFDNILSADFLDSIETYKNVTLVAGEGEGSNRKTAIAGDSTASGLTRRELFTDARDLSTTTSGGTIATDVYLSQLKQRGKEKLSENKKTKEFNGEVDADGLYKYNKDFYLGDIVHFYDEYRNGTQVRVTEMIFSWDENGSKAYPAFEVIDEED